MMAWLAASVSSSGSASCATSYRPGLYRYSCTGKVFVAVGKTTGDLFRILVLVKKVRANLNRHLRGSGRITRAIGSLRNKLSGLHVGALNKNYVSSLD